MRRNHLVFRRLLCTRASHFFLACSKHAHWNQIAQEQDDDVFRMRKPPWDNYGGEKCLNNANDFSIVHQSRDSRWVEEMRIEYEEHKQRNC